MTDNYYPSTSMKRKTDIDFNSGCAANEAYIAIYDNNYYQRILFMMLKHVFSKI